MRTLVAVVVLAASSAFAQVDLKTSFPMLLKTLTWDANFDTRGVGPFVVLVVSNAASAAARHDTLVAVEACAVTKVKQRPLKYVEVELKNEAQLEAATDQHHASGLSLSGYRALVLINEHAARAVGMRLDNTVLKAARVF